MSRWLAAALLVVVTTANTAAYAVQCQSGTFDGFLDGIRQQAAASGISQRGITTALAGVTNDPNVIAHDRGQKVFRQTFEEFSGRMIPPRVAPAVGKIKQQAATFARIEEQFGVSAPILAAPISCIPRP